MSWRAALLGAVTLVFAVSFAPALATATAELACHGRAATLAGTPGQVLQGTAGADVMVTNGATEAYAGGGDDLVCVTPAAETVFINGDAGDDTIDADGVQAGRWWKDADGFAPDDDLVTTGGGLDHVTTGGHLSFPDGDTIDLGPGADTLTIFGDNSATGSWSGGVGSDTLEVERATRSGRWKLDNRAGRASVGGLSIGRWDSLERFVASRFPAGSTLLFRGGSRPERLTLFGPPTVASMGPGDDHADGRGGNDVCVAESTRRCEA